VGGVPGILGLQNQWGEVPKMLHFKNWKLIENRFLRNTSDAINLEITMRYLFREFALISA